jgi:hypothetical protein
MCVLLLHLSWIFLFWRFFGVVLGFVWFICSTVFSFFFIENIHELLACEVPVCHFCYLDGLDEVF